MTVDEYPIITNDTSLVPIPAEPQLPPATHVVPLLVAFDTMTDGTNRAMFNNITYNTPIVPAILSALSLDEVAGSGASAVASAYGPWNFVLQHGDIVDIELMNSDSGKHPLYAVLMHSVWNSLAYPVCASHLHGHKFQIVKRANDYTSDDPTLNPPIVEGQANPVRRDTVQVPGGESATLRFVADNPGAWFFHCKRAILL